MHFLACKILNYDYDTEIFELRDAIHVGYKYAADVEELWLLDDVFNRVCYYNNGIVSEVKENQEVISLWQQKEQNRIKTSFTSAGYSAKIFSVKW